MVNQPEVVSMTASQRTVTHADIDDLIEGGVPVSQIAVEAGISPRDLERWCKGRLDDETGRRLSEWWSSREAEAEANDPGFIETPTAREIFRVAEQAATRPCIGTIVGAPGTGKSFALQELFRRKGRFQAGWSPHGGWIYTQVSGAQRSAAALFKHLADVGGQRFDAYRVDTLVEVFTRHLAEGDLVMIDEAQWLELDALDTLRIELLDRRGIGLLFAGNEEISTRFSGRGRYARFAQISSRNMARVHLTSPTQADVDAILTAYGVAGRNERALAIGIATAHGGLRMLVETIREARRKFAAHGGKLSAQALKVAAERIGALDIA